MLNGEQKQARKDDTLMFNNYEALKCDKCRKAYIGRKPAEGGITLCPDCVASNELPVVNEGDKVPETVHDEVKDGRAEDE